MDAGGAEVNPVPSTERERQTDPIAAVTIVVAGLAALLIAGWLPWWSMHAQAPQYGKQTLVVDISPSGPVGDVKEIDTLGHYVGIKPLSDLAPFERRLAPFGFLAAAIGFVVAPITRRKLVKGVLIAPIVALSVFFLWDLRYWTLRSVTDRDPNAALSNTVKEIHPRLEGEYAVGQFKVDAHVGGGLCAAGLAGILAIGLFFMPPAPIPEALRRRFARRGSVMPPVAAAIAFLAIGVRAHSGAAATERVVPSGGTIGAAIAAADPGDTIVVPAGTYREHLTIDKPLSLTGRPGAVLDGDGTGTVVRVTSERVSLHGLEIRNSGNSYTTEDAGVRIDHAADVQIAGVALHDVLFGVFVVQGDRCRIENSTITGREAPVTRRGDSIRLWYSSGCKILGNVIENSRDLVIWYSSDTDVEDNTVRRSRYGLHYMFSDRNYFRGNRFESNQVGAAIMNSRGIRLESNTFSLSNGPSAYGLFLKDADDVTVERNRFESNAIALFVDNAPQSRGAFVHIVSNLISGNDVAVALQPLSRNADFSGNAFIGNRTEVQVRGSGSAEGERWSDGARGNYWSTAIPYDRDGDGVSEIPFKIESSFESLAGNHPELAFFAGTPGADAIDQAARLFPIFASRPTLTDPHPLVAPPELGVPPAVAGGGKTGLAFAGSALAIAAGTSARVLRRWIA